jgi:hypothetical protein
MKNAGLLLPLLLAATVVGPPRLPAQQEASSAPAVPRVIETEQRLGTFVLGGQSYTVLARSQTISPASSTRFATTVSEVEIRDANSATAYREIFPTSPADGRFLQTMTVSASLLEGTGGQALVLRFIEDAEPAGGKESWQMFGLVGGQFTRYGAPLPLGQGGAAINGVLTGVMLRGGIGVVPLASTADALEFRVWAGSFFVGVPVRIAWATGQWSEAEQCFSNADGSLQPTGCNLRVIAARGAVPEGATVTLYAQPEENAYTARQIPVRQNSAVEFPSVRARVEWRTVGDRFSCDVKDLWLRVRIDGNEGWVHSAADLAALGLPAAGATP